MGIYFGREIFTRYHPAVELAESRCFTAVPQRDSVGCC